jgi:RHS repeat-associated protein
VEQQSTQAGITTTTVYVGNLEQVATTGNTTTNTTYYYANGQRIALAVNGVFSYLASDALGSAAVALNASGSVKASSLYAPYGGTRYSNGTMPTDYGFTGQRADATTGLDYYNARYYDPLAGQFASADGILPGGGFDLLGLSRYAYVEGNPVIRSDPSGRKVVCEGCGSVSYKLCYDAGNAACGTALYWKDYVTYRGPLAGDATQRRLAVALVIGHHDQDPPHLSLTPEQRQELKFYAYGGWITPGAQAVLNGYEDNLAGLLATAMVAGGLSQSGGVRFAARTGTGSEGEGVSLGQARAAAERNGIDMSDIDLRYVPKSSPEYKSGTKGSTAFNGIWEPMLNAQGRYEIVLQDEGLTSEYEAYATILHEIIHTSNPVAGEADVESLAVGIAEEGYIR